MREIDQFDPSDLPDFCRKPTVVLGIGNILFGDDGFGCAVVDYVEAHYPVPEAVCLRTPVPASSKQTASGTR